MSLRRGVVAAQHRDQEAVTLQRDGIDRLLARPVRRQNSAKPGHLHAQVGEIDIYVRPRKGQKLRCGNDFAGSRHKREQEAERPAADFHRLVVQEQLPRVHRQAETGKVVLLLRPFGLPW
jgi:hypothetical protein